MTFIKIIALLPLHLILIYSFAQVTRISKQMRATVREKCQNIYYKCAPSMQDLAGETTDISVALSFIVPHLEQGLAILPKGTKLILPWF